MEYVDLTYYKDNFGGAEIEETEFKNALIWATAKVNQITLGRISKLVEVPDCVKNAICAVIQKFAIQKKRTDTEAVSETNDGYSITYAAPKSTKDFDCEVDNCIKMHLSGTGLMYRGFLPKYDLRDGDEND